MAFRVVEGTFEMQGTVSGTDATTVVLTDPTQNAEHTAPNILRIWVENPSTCPDVITTIFNGPFTVLNTTASGSNVQLVGAGETSVTTDGNVITISGTPHPITGEPDVDSINTATGTITINGADGITVLTDLSTPATPTITVSGFETSVCDKIVTTSGYLQTQIDSVGGGPGVILGAGGNTVISGSNEVTVSGFYDEFVSASGSLQNQIDTINVDEIEPAIVGADGITVISGANTTTVSGFRTEFVSASGSLQNQIDNIDSSVTLQDAYDNSTSERLIVTNSGEPVTISGQSTTQLNIIGDVPNTEPLIRVDALDPTGEIFRVFDEDGIQVFTINGAENFAGGNFTNIQLAQNRGGAPATTVKISAGGQNNLNNPHLLIDGWAVVSSGITLSGIALDINAIVGADGITVVSGSPTLGTTTVSGFRDEFVSASGSLQTQIDNIDSSVTLQDAYDNGDGIIETSSSAKPVVISGSTVGDLLLIQEPTTALALRVRDDYVQVNNPLRGASGSAATPSYTFTNDIDTGLYQDASDVLGISAGGDLVVVVSGATTGNEGVGIDGKLTVDRICTVSGIVSESLTVSGSPVVLAPGVDLQRAYDNSPDGLITIPPGIGQKPITISGSFSGFDHSLVLGGQDVVDLLFTDMPSVLSIYGESSFGHFTIRGLAPEAQPQFFGTTARGSFDAPQISQGGDVAFAMGGLAHDGDNYATLGGINAVVGAPVVSGSNIIEGRLGFFTTDSTGNQNSVMNVHSTQSVSINEPNPATVAPYSFYVAGSGIFTEDLSVTNAFDADTGAFTTSLTVSGSPVCINCPDFSTFALQSELLTVSGHLQSEIDAIDSSVTLQDAYNNGNTITTVSGSPITIDGAADSSSGLINVDTTGMQAAIRRDTASTVPLISTANTISANLWLLDVDETILNIVNIDIGGTHISNFNLTDGSAGNSLNFIVTDLLSACSMASSTPVMEIAAGPGSGGFDSQLNLDAGTGGRITLNNDGLNVDTIIRGDTDGFLFMSDAGTDRVGIGTDTPGEKLSVEGTISGSTLKTGDGNVIGLIEDQSGMIDLPIGKNYTLVQSAKYDFTIGEITHQTVAGTCSGTLTINGTAVEGLDNMIMNSSETTSTATASFTVSAGDKVQLAISGTTDAEDLAFTWQRTRL